MIWNFMKHVIGDQVCVAVLLKRLGFTNFDTEDLLVIKLWPGMINYAPVSAFRYCGTSLSLGCKMLLFSSVRKCSSTYTAVPVTLASYRGRYHWNWRQCLWYVGLYITKNLSNARRSTFRCLAASCMLFAGYLLTTSQLFVALYIICYNLYWICIHCIFYGTGSAQRYVIREKVTLRTSCITRYGRNLYITGNETAVQPSGLLLFCFLASSHRIDETGLRKDFRSWCTGRNSLQMLVVQPYYLYYNSVL